MRLLHRSGNTRTLVLIHGLGSSHSAWSSRTIEALIGGHDANVYSFEYPTSFTNSTGSAISYDEIACALRDEIVRYGLHNTSLYLVGHSQGGLVALYYTVQFIESHGLDGIVLLGAPRLGSTTADVMWNINSERFSDHVGWLQTLSSQAVGLALEMHKQRGQFPRVLNILGKNDIHAPITRGVIPYPFATNLKFNASHSGLRRLHLHPNILESVCAFLNGDHLIANVDGFDAPRTLLVQAPKLPTADNSFSLEDLETAISTAFSYRQVYETTEVFEQYLVRPPVFSRCSGNRHWFYVPHIPTGLYSVDLHEALTAVSKDDSAICAFLRNWLGGVSKFRFDARIYNCGIHVISICEPGSEHVFDDLLPLQLAPPDHISVAISQGDVRLARQLISSGWDMDMPGVTGSVSMGDDLHVPVLKTPLMAAIESNKLDIAMELLSLGASVDWCCARGENALSTAIREKQTELIQPLLDRGARLPPKMEALGLTVEKLIEPQNL